jgi:hypothetical protein
MHSSMKLSVCGALALLMAACSSTTTDNTTDGGSSNADTGVTTNPSGDSGNPNTTPDSSTTPTSEAGTGGEGGSCTPPSGGFTGDTTCDTCIENSCCQAALTCFNDKACLDANNCLAGCSNGEMPNDGGTFDAADQSDGGAADQCQTACLNGVSQTVQDELAANIQCLGVTCKSSCTH